ncbi:adenosylcobinamide-phosphate synthase CbiB [Paenibacillus senegalensis]|uniref:adenosylcobinamide-phosphate synthase CbiB n=1 Tax=Paenibacillus senegalensis TaxID=1465766 RepID=UPI000289D2AE|nr:adenosylcobinamide-phosphate synthase CbiB [Paenibacillus senegalensis]
MLFFSLQETLIMLVAAILLDACVGDPKWPVHPVIRIGQLIQWLERRLRPGSKGARQNKEFADRELRWRGIVLAAFTVGTVLSLMWAALAAAKLIHPWLAYALNIWFIASTIAVKGLRDAAYQVYAPLQEGKLDEARSYVGYIVGRDTAQLDEQEISRAAVETVAENTVDAFISPLFFALLGGAPLAIAYRAVNTLDSMVGYKNERYLHFGWFSARLDDVLNWLPARITGGLMVLSAWSLKGLSAKRALLSIRRFASAHPSPNSGIPEAAAAGAMGVQLGGRNYYQGQVSERARMGWPQVQLSMQHIHSIVLLLYRVRSSVIGGLVLLWLVLRIA